MTHNDPDAEFTGKYEKSGRVGRWLVDRFYSDVRKLLIQHTPVHGTVLEIGCGAGYSSERILSWIPDDLMYVGSDIGHSLLVKSLGRNPGVPFVRQSVYELALADKSVDVVIMLEVLEHLERPAAALAELRRVARKAAIISTPREPLWRVLNCLRGKYLHDCGNTPGHIQHWSSNGLRKLVMRDFEVVGMAQPVPWTVLAGTPRP